MGREYCETCETLKELYRLKLNQFLLAARSASATPPGPRVGEDELLVLKDETLAALRGFLQHANACFGLAQQDEAA